MSRTMSPFRYPGGKTQLYKFIKHTLEINHITDGTYIEAFAGGAGLAIKLLTEGEVSNIWINDYDKSIYSVWHAILHHPNQLINKINEVPFDYYDDPLSENNDTNNLAYWKSIKSLYIQEKNYQNSIDNAFATLFLNRTTRSGIINGGPVGGYSQKGTKIYARFNKKTLIDKIKLINSRKNDITLTRIDALKFIPILKESIDADNTFIFFDPPYYNQGNNLYFSSFTHNDHIAMSKSIMTLDDYNWITTYDNTNTIKDIYLNSDKKFEYDIRYTANNLKRGISKEVMFSNNYTRIESFSNVILKDI
ncbi:DNA adenine methylase [Latilactobacillus sakei]